MKSRILLTRGAYFFIPCLIVFVIMVKTTKPRILILHSYAPDFTWVAQINTGVQRVLKGKPYSIRYHYMDTKRHPDEDFKIKAGIAARKMIDQWKPHVIIAVDDNAQEYVAKHYCNRPGINIVFCGVNAEHTDYGYDRASNVTGILERIPIASVREGLQSAFYPERRRIYHIADASETSEYISVELNAYNWEPFHFGKSVLCEAFDEWKGAVREATASADILLITHYHTIRRSAQDPSTVPPREVIRWTMENTPLPIVGCWGFFVEDGGVLAFALSSFEQGEEAAKMASSIVENRKKPHEIPVSVSRQLLVCAREGELKRHHINLPAIYEAFARATGNYFP